MEVTEAIMELHEVQTDEVLYKYNCQLIVEELYTGKYSEVKFSDVDLIMLLEGIIGK